MDAIVNQEIVMPKDSTVIVETVRYAGLIRRFIALTLDVILLTVIMFIPALLVMAALIVVAANADLDDIDFIYPIITIVYIGAIWLYFSWFESSSNMATPGKMVMGLKVMDINGNRITFGRAVLRTFLKFIFTYILDYLVPIVASVYWLGNILTRFTNDKKRCLHDILGGTVVVYGHAEK